MLAASEREGEMSLKSRIEKIETRDIGAPVMLWVRGDQDPEEVKARHLAAHPEDQSRELMFIRWLRPGEEIAQT